MRVAETKCLEFAARQDGVIHRAQALRLGLSAGTIESRLRAKRWGVRFRSVYCITGAPPGWLQQLRAASLWARRDYAISHRAAAALMGLARFREGPVEVSATRHLRLPAPAIVHQVALLSPHDVRDFRGLRVTTAARTLVDLCATEDTQTLEATADEMLRRRLTTLELLEDALTRLKGRRGISFLRDLVKRYRGGEQPTESELEAKGLEVIDNAGLPRPTKQVKVFAGAKLRRVDFMYPEKRIIIEADSALHHSSPDARERDRLRRNALACKGNRVLVWTWNDVTKDADRLAQELADALERPG